MAETRIDIDSALADQLAHNPVDMLTRWVVVAEFVTPTGKKYLTRDNESMMSPWDIRAFGAEMEADWGDEA